MILVSLKGGLGNQMFQYACGRAISLRHAQTLKLDLSGFDHAMKSDTPRMYGLDSWNIVESIATPDEIRKAKYPLGIVTKVLRFLRKKILRRFYVPFVPWIVRFRHNGYLEGFFQDERYFADFADEIRKDFTPKNPLSQKSASMLEEIRSDERSLSIHVRRGDYATTASAEFPTLPPSYYKDALAYVKDRIPDARAYVFSDDIEWAKKNLELPADAIFVSSPNTPHFEEIVLMSACRHHIIANSTFSWWGAWLNPLPDKIVVAPKQWSRKHASWYKDITPPTWIRL